MKTPEAGTGLDTRISRRDLLKGAAAGALAGFVGREASASSPETATFDIEKLTTSVDNIELEGLTKKVSSPNLGGYSVELPHGSFIRPLETSPGVFDADKLECPDTNMSTFKIVQRENSEGLTLNEWVQAYWGDRNNIPAFFQEHKTFVYPYGDPLVAYKYEAHYPDKPVTEVVWMEGDYIKRMIQYHNRLDPRFESDHTLLALASATLRAEDFDQTNTAQSSESQR